MRTARFAVFLLVHVGVVTASFAHDADSCVFSDDEQESVCHHYFEQTTVELPLKNRPTSECERVVVGVLQKQGMLLAPLREPIVFERDRCSAMDSISLELPSVRAETDLQIQITQTDREPDQGALLEQPTDVVMVRVYPDTLLDPLVHLAEKNSIIVYDTDAVLRNFFEQHDVNYISGFGALTGDPIALFVDYDDPERLIEGSSINTAVIFREKIIDLPQIRAVANNGQTRIYIEMNFLHDLHASPLTQKAFMKIIELALNPNQPDRG